MGDIWYAVIPGVLIYIALIYQKGRKLKESDKTNMPEIPTEDSAVKHSQDLIAIKAAEPSLQEQINPTYEEINDIEKIVKQRKIEAEQLKLPELALALYKEAELWNYKRENESKLPDYLSDFSVNCTDTRKTTFLATFINGESLQLNLLETGYDKEDEFEWKYYQLEIEYEEKIVFSTKYKITIVHSRDDMQFTKSTYGIDAYIPGEWVEKHQALLRQIGLFNLVKNQNIHRAILENPKRVNELKKKFGI